MNHDSPSDLSLETQAVESDYVDLADFRRELCRPFLGNYRYMEHIVPEWVNHTKTAVRLRVFNGGYDPESYFFPSNRYCIGMVAVVSSVGVHFLGELHKPLPKREPHHFAFRLTPALGKLVVRGSKANQLEIEDNVESIDEHLREVDELVRIADIEDYLKKYSLILRYSKYQKHYTLPKQQPSRQGTSFTLIPQLAKEGCHAVDLDTESARMNRILYY